MSKNQIAILGSVITILYCTPVASLADSIAIPNGSFESPSTPYVSINIDSWEKSAKPDDYVESGGFLWSQLTGIFTNRPGTPDYIDNCDGNQALWLFAVPEVGLFQDYNSTDWHNQPNHQLNATFTIGRSYHLFIGVIGSGGGMLEGATLDLSLYYRDSSSNRVNVAATTLTNTPTVFSNNTHFVECRVDVPTIKASDVWAGQYIGIQVKSTVSTNTEGGYWDLDNVRLLEGPVLLNPILRGGEFEFTLLGAVGAAFEIVTTTNVNSPMEQWRPAGTVTNISGMTIFTKAVENHGQFFRAHQLP